MEYFLNGEWGNGEHWIDYHEENGSITTKKASTRNLTHWLRSVVQWVGNQHPDQPIGVIGMCLTGSIPLALLDNPQIRAVVVAQPSLPFMFWGTSFDRHSLDLSDVEIENAQKRVLGTVQQNPVEIYGLRFEGDCIARKEKFDLMRQLFGENAFS